MIVRSFVREGLILSHPHSKASLFHQVSGTSLIRQSEQFPLSLISLLWISSSISIRTSFPAQGAMDAISSLRPFPLGHSQSDRKVGRFSTHQKFQIRVPSVALLESILEAVRILESIS